MVEKIVDLIIGSIPKIEARTKLNNRKHGADPMMPIDVFQDLGALAAAFENIPEEQHLKAKLMRFDADLLLKVEAVMYYGRDQIPGKFRNKLGELRRLNDSKDQIVDTLLEKIPSTDRYLRKGVKRLAREHLTLATI